MTRAAHLGRAGGRLAPGPQLLHQPRDDRARPAVPDVLFRRLRRWAVAGRGSIPGFDYGAGYTAFVYGFVLLQASAFGGMFTGFSIARDFESGFARRMLLRRTAAQRDHRGVLARSAGPGRVHRPGGHGRRPAGGHGDPRRWPGPARPLHAGPAGSTPRRRCSPVAWRCACGPCQARPGHAGAGLLHHVPGAGLGAGRAARGLGAGGRRRRSEPRGDLPRGRSRAIAGSPEKALAAFAVALALVAVWRSGRAEACAAPSARPDLRRGTLRAMVADEAREVREGEGFAVANLDGLGEGFGFRKVRRELGSRPSASTASCFPRVMRRVVTTTTSRRSSTSSSEGQVHITLGDDNVHELGPGGLARVDAATVRRIKNVGDGPAVLLVVGGKDGYVGRDGKLAEGRPVVEGPGRVPRCRPCASAARAGTTTTAPAGSTRRAWASRAG